MATNRYISTGFWDDEWVQTLNPDEKLMYLYLLTNTLTNIAGVYKITIRRIVFDVGLDEARVSEILEKFQKDKKAYYYNGYIILPAWPQHQKADTRSKIKDGIDAILKELPKNIISYMVSIGYRYHIDGYAYESNYSDSDSDSDSDLNNSGATTAPSTQKESLVESLPNLSSEDTNDQEKERETETEEEGLGMEEGDEKKSAVIKIDHNSQEFMLANLLYSLHKGIVDQKFNVSDARIETWAKDIERLHRIDGRDWQEIEHVIRWAKNDSFWASNIISGKKLREKFPTLIAQMNRKTISVHSGVAPPKVFSRTEFLDIQEG
jgi:hypothetical protein